MGKKHQLVAFHMPPTRDLACNPGMCPDWESNWRPFVRRLELSPLSHTSQGYDNLYKNNDTTCLRLYSKAMNGDKKLSVPFMPSLQSPCCPGDIFGYRQTF